MYTKFMTVIPIGWLINQYKKKVKEWNKAKTITSCFVEKFRIVHQFQKHIAKLQKPNAWKLVVSTNFVPVLWFRDAIYDSNLCSLKCSKPIQEWSGKSSKLKNRLVLTMLGRYYLKQHKKMVSMFSKCQH